METPEEKKRKALEQRIYSANIPMKKGSASALKLKQLKKEMMKMTGATPTPKVSKNSGGFEQLLQQMMLKNNYGGYGVVSGSSVGSTSLKPGQVISANYNAVWGDEEEDKRLVLFYGFNGLLPKKYSIIKDKTKEEISARMSLTGDKVPWKIESYSEFKKVLDMFDGTPNALNLIEFDDAMNIIRIGNQEIKVDDFEDAEVDEFDDDCLPTCKPSKHSCGK